MPPPICEEQFDSRDRTEGANPTATLRYWAKFYQDDTDALAAVIAESPTEHDGLLRRGVGLKIVGPDIWSGDVSYGKASLEEGSWDFTFDGSGGTQKFTQSLRTRSRTPIGDGIAFDFGGMIGVADSGGKMTVEGCEVPIPKYSFTIAYRFPSRFVNRAYGVVCGSLVGTTNARPFWGYAANTLLYMGPSGKFSGSMSAGSRPMAVEIGHRFDFSRHMQVTVAGKTVTKYGWDYLWVRYIEKKDPSGESRGPRPQAIYCEKLAEEANFAALGIGV